VTESGLIICTIFNDSENALGSISTIESKSGLIIIFCISIDFVKENSDEIFDRSIQKYL